MQKTRGFGRQTVLMLVVLSPLYLAGCGAIQDGISRISEFPSISVDYTVDRALAQVMRGRYGSAEQELENALKYNPYDPYALFVLASLYQMTGRHPEAAGLYQTLLMTEPEGRIANGPWGDMRVSSLRDLALGALQGLEKSDVPVPGVPIPGVSIPSLPSDPGLLATDYDIPPGLDPAAARFLIMKRLYNEGLMTPDEYNRRRVSNLGALLPYSALPPAFGLEATPPMEGQLRDRLLQLRKNLEGRSISQQQFAEERDRILDALLPVAPKVRAGVIGKPLDAEQAMRARDRIDLLLGQGLISRAEADRELAALGATESGKTAVAPEAAKASASAEPVKTAAPSPVTSGAVPLLPGSNPAAVLRSGREPLSVIPNPPAVIGGPEQKTQDQKIPEQKIPEQKTPEQAVPLVPPAAAGPAGSVPEAPQAGFLPSPQTQAPQTQEPQAGGEMTGGGMSGGVTAVHLASFRTQGAALSGWKELQAKYPALRTLQSYVTSVQLPDQGTFYRLNAGPLSSRDQAAALCRSLSGLYCEPVFLGG